MKSVSAKPPERIGLSAAERAKTAAGLRCHLQWALGDIASGMERDLFVVEETGEWEGAPAFNRRLYRLRLLAKELWPNLPKVPRPPRVLSGKRTT